jgi:hypothetical protein
LPNLRKIEDDSWRPEEKIPKKIYTQLEQIMTRNSAIRPYTQYKIHGTSTYTSESLYSTSDKKIEDHDVLADPDGLPF